MSKKLSMSPDLSYMLGICTLGKEEPSISVSSSSYEVIERFAKIALDSLGIDPRKIIISEDGDSKKALFYNSMLKKLMAKAMLERERIFKYKNEYSGSYFAGLFDVRGRGSPKGIWSGTRDMTDIIVLERLGFMVSRAGKVRNANDYLSFIKPYSASL
jgi:hypothetical protein